MDMAKALIPIADLHPSLKGLANTFHYEGDHYTLLRELSRILDKIDKFDSEMSRKKKIEIRKLELAAGKELALALLQLRDCLSRNTHSSEPQLLQTIDDFCPRYLPPQVIADTMSALETQQMALASQPPASAPPSPKQMIQPSEPAATAQPDNSQLAAQVQEMQRQFTALMQAMTKMTVADAPAPQTIQSPAVSTEATTSNQISETQILPVVNTHPMVAIPVVNTDPTGDQTAASNKRDYLIRLKNMASQPDTYIAGSFSEWTLHKMTPDGPDLVFIIQAIPDVEYRYKFRKGRKGKWFCDLATQTIKIDGGDTLNVFTIELYEPLDPQVTLQELDNIELEDDQDGPENLLNAYTSGALSTGSIRQWRALFSLNGNTFQSGLHYSTAEPWTSIAIRLPDNQRSSMTLRINLPRDMNPANNPGRFESHCLNIVIHACRVTACEYTELPTGERVPGFNTESLQFLKHDGTRYPLALMKVQSLSAQVTGGIVPPLINKELDAKVTALINTIRQSSDDYTFQFLIRAEEPLMRAMAEAFRASYLAEQMHDPAKDWIQNSPNAEAFQMGNLLDQFSRPHIDLQHAQTVFLDKKDYLIPQIYGSYIDEEYQQEIIKELHADRFDMRLMESPGANNPADGVPTAEVYDSTARAYFAFIDFSDKELVRPEVGSRLRVTLLEYPKDLLENDDKEDNNKEVDKDEDSSDKDEGDDASNHSQASTDDLGHEDDHDVFDMEQDDSPLPNEWSATVIDPTAITPPGSLTLILERRRDPNYRGRRSERPFVNFTVPTVNFRVAKSEDDLATRVQAAPTIRVAVETTYSRQGFVDQVRCADELWRGLDPQKGRIRLALLCHNPDSSPLKRVDLLALKGTSSLNLTASFNPAQKAAYNSLASTPEITLIHGPFGTGKTTFNIATALEVISNPTTNNKILYLVESNPAVDDVALRMRRLADASSMKHKVILRAHTLKAEKLEVYRYFDTQGKPQERFHVTDDFVAELSTLAYLNKLAAEHKAIRARSDPRRVLTEMSIAQAMFNKIQSAKGDSLDVLGSLLRDYAENGFYDTDVATRINIKLKLNDLLATVLQEADVIVCTVAAAAKVTLADNFKPTLVYVDEAARITELKNLIPFGLYSPRAFILSADHKQLRPTVLSADRHRDNPPFINPFQHQALLSLFERLIAAGQEHIMLKIQHRCAGSIPGWVSKQFYHDQVERALLTQEKKDLLQTIRSFVHEQLGVTRPTNRYAVDLTGAQSEKENGGTSSLNTYEVQHIMNDLRRIRAHPALQNMTVGILSFYKAQVTRLKSECFNLPGVTVVDGNEHLSPITVKTVDSAQGAEFDIVLLSLVRSTRPAFLAEPHRLVVALTRAKWMLGIYTTWSLVQGRHTDNAGRHLISLFNDLRANHHIATRVAKELTCLKCHQPGHIARECNQERVPKCIRCQEHNDDKRAIGHTAANCPHYERPPREPRCHECREIGHRRANCPLVTCAACGILGHSAAACTKPQVCLLCHQEGHTKRECTTVLSRAFFNQQRGEPVSKLRLLQLRATGEGHENATDNTVGWNVSNTNNASGWNAESNTGKENAPDSTAEWNAMNNEEASGEQANKALDMDTKEATDNDQW